MRRKASASAAGGVRYSAWRTRAARRAPRSPFTSAGAGWTGGGATTSGSALMGAPVEVNRRTGGYGVDAPDPKLRLRGWSVEAPARSGMPDEVGHRVQDQPHHPPHEGSV